MISWSLELFVVLYDLIELAQLGLLVLVELLYDELLSVDAVTRLLRELLQRRLHPVAVVLSWSYLGLCQLLLYISPDFSHLEVRVHLDHF